MIVIDASILANLVADDHTDGDAARERVRRAQIVIAPDLVDVEVASVLRRRWIVGDIDDARLTSAARDLSELPIERVPTRALIARALELRANVTPYDAVYVALAEAQDCVLVTADRRLATAPRIRCHVEVLG